MAKTPINLEHFDRMAVDEDSNQLFWDGKAVMTVVSLPWWVQVSALAGGLGTAVSAAAAVIELVHRFA